MEGDVLVYNCLSFANKMHGVTDNSNPGFIQIPAVVGVTVSNTSVEYVAVTYCKFSGKSVWTTDFT